MKRIFIALVVVTLSVFGFVTMAWQAEWAEIVAAAKREGSVVVVGPQGNETREALTVGFQKKYPEIRVEHSSAAGAQLPPKLLAEQKAERYSVDVLVQGTTTGINGLMRVKAVFRSSRISSVPTATIPPHGLTKNSVSLTKPDNITW